MLRFDRDRALCRLATFVVNSFDFFQCFSHSSRNDTGAHRHGYDHDVFIEIVSLTCMDLVFIYLVLKLASGTPRASENNLTYFLNMFYMKQLLWGA